MKKILSAALLCLFMLGFTVGAVAQGIQFEPAEQSWATTLAKAKKDNKLVFVDAFTTWCGPCKMMAKDIFPQKAVGDLYNKQFVCAKIDMEKGEGVTLAQRYNVRAYPTYLFVNGDGELVHRSLGSMEEGKFLAVGKAAKDPDQQFFSLKTRFEKGERSEKFLKNFVAACDAAQETDLLPTAADAYLATQKDWSNKENKEFILHYTKSLEQPTFAYLLKNKAAFEADFGALEVNTVINEMAYNGVGKAAFLPKTRTFDMEKAKMTAEKYLPEAYTAQVISFLTYTQSRLQGKMPQYIEQMIAHFVKYPSVNPNEMNSTAWAIYENSADKAQLTQALAWSLKSIELFENYAFLDTAASLYFKIGDKKNAKIYAEKAIATAEKEGEDAEATKELLKKIAETK